MFTPRRWRRRMSTSRALPFSHCRMALSAAAVLASASGTTSAGDLKNFGNRVSQVANQMVPPSMTSILLAPSIPAAARLIPGTKEKESEVHRQHLGAQQADATMRKGVKRQVEVYQRTADKFGERVSEGKVADAPFMMRRDLTDGIRENAAKMMSESDRVRAVAHGAANVVAPGVGSPLLDTWHTYEVTGDARKAGRAGMTSAATSAGSAGIAKAAPGSSVAAVTGRAVGSAVVSGAAAQSSGTTPSQSRKAAMDGAKSSIAGSVVHGVASSESNAAQTAPRAQYASNKVDASRHAKDAAAANESAQADATAASQRPARVNRSKSISREGEQVASLRRTKVPFESTPDGQQQLHPDTATSDGLKAVASQGSVHGGHQGYTRKEWIEIDNLDGSKSRALVDKVHHGHDGRGSFSANPDSTTLYYTGRFNGTVTRVGPLHDSKSGKWLGNAIHVEGSHEGHQYKTTYMHLGPRVHVAEGQRVWGGVQTPLATGFGYGHDFLRMSGSPAKVHYHWEVWRDGERINVSNGDVLPAARNRPKEGPKPVAVELPGS